MNFFLTFKFCIIIFHTLNSVKCNDKKKYFQLPKDVLIGVASASYQVEGAWNVSDKSESNWDYYVHNFPNRIANRSNGDIACDAYHKYQEDVQLLKKNRFQFYRFSISWPRLLPRGTHDYISENGLNYYDSLINELVKQEIEPFVTIYHWDHPQIYEKYGGWLNESMAYSFSHYAKVVYEKFGDRVKFFTTINEPNIFCSTAYQSKYYPPGIESDGNEKYECIQNMLKGHALAYHIYNDLFRKKQRGKVGIVEHCGSYYGKKKSDKKTELIAHEYTCGLTMNPIFSKSGDYPEIIKKRIAYRSALQGYTRSKLPVLTSYWIKKIKGSSDYFGLNHYLTALVSPLTSEPQNWPDDSGFETSFDPKWPSTSMPLFKIAPEGFGKLLRLIKNKYNNPEIYVLENGVALPDDIEDNVRIGYVCSYLKEIIKAKKQANCNIKSYTYWSLFDSLEWNFGYELKFGILKVDMSNKNRTRSLKNSLTWFKNLLISRNISCD